MALTRGVNGSFPCPVCLVPNAEQSILSRWHQLRISTVMERLWTDTQNMTATDREDSLRSVGLRDVQVLLLHPYLYVTLIIDATTV